jgi:hypothetical protein
MKIYNLHLFYNYIKICLFIQLDNNEFLIKVYNYSIIYNDTLKFMKEIFNSTFS